MWSSPGVYFSTEIHRNRHWRHRLGDGRFLTSTTIMHSTLIQIRDTQLTAIKRASRRTAPTLSDDEHTHGAALNSIPVTSMPLKDVTTRKRQPILVQSNQPSAAPLVDDGALLVRLMDLAGEQGTSLSSDRKTDA